MRKIYYLKGLAVAALSPYMQLIQDIANDTLKPGAEAERLHENLKIKIFSARRNRYDRLLYTIIEDGDDQGSIVICGVADDHDYDAVLRRLKAQEGSLRRILPLQIDELEDEEEDDVATDMTTPVAEYVEMQCYGGRCIEFDDGQAQVLRTSLPAIIHGAPGTGKTVIGARLIIQYVQNPVTQITKFGTVSLKALFLFPTNDLAMQTRQSCLAACAVAGIAGSDLDALAQFVTYDAFLRECIPVEQQAMATVTDFTAFNAWYKDQSKATKKALKEHGLTAQGCWAAFRICSLYADVAQYESLATHQCAVPPELRAQIYNIYAAYKKYCMEHNQYSLRVSEFSRAAKFGLVVLDESHNQSGCTILSAYNLAYGGRFVALVGNHQQIDAHGSQYDGGLAAVDLLAHGVDGSSVKQTPGVTVFTKHILKNSHRNSTTVVNVVNCLVQLKKEVGLGSLVKGTDCFLHGDNGEEGEARIVIAAADKQAFTKLQQDFRGRADVAIIVPASRLTEARQRWPGNILLSAVDAMGLEFPYVICDGLLSDGEGSLKVGRLLPDAPQEAKAEGNRAKRAATAEVEQQGPWFNNLITACSRATTGVYFVEEDKFTHTAQKVFDRVSASCGQQPVQTAAQPKILSTQAEWFARACNMLQQNTQALDAEALRVMDANIPDKTCDIYQQFLKQYQANQQRRQSERASVAIPAMPSAARVSLDAPVAAIAVPAMKAAEASKPKAAVKKDTASKPPVASSKVTASAPLSAEKPKAIVEERKDKITGKRQDKAAALDARPVTVVDTLPSKSSANHDLIAPVESAKLAFLQLTAQDKVMANILFTPGMFTDDFLLRALQSPNVFLLFGYRCEQKDNAYYQKSLFTLLFSEDNQKTLVRVLLNNPVLFQNNLLERWEGLAKHEHPDTFHPILHDKLVVLNDVRMVCIKRFGSQSITVSQLLGEVLRVNPSHQIFKRADEAGMDLSAILQDMEDSHVAVAAHDGNLKAQAIIEQQATSREQSIAAPHAIASESVITSVAIASVDMQSQAVLSQHQSSAANVPDDSGLLRSASAPLSATEKPTKAAVAGTRTDKAAANIALEPIFSKEITEIANSLFAPGVFDARWLLHGLKEFDVLVLFTYKCNQKDNEYYNQPLFKKLFLEDNQIILMRVLLYNLQVFKKNVLALKELEQCISTKDNQPLCEMLYILHSSYDLFTQACKKALISLQDSITLAQFLSVLFVEHSDHGIFLMAKSIGVDLNVSFRASGIQPVIESFCIDVIQRDSLKEFNYLNKLGINTMPVDGFANILAEHAAFYGSVKILQFMHEQMHLDLKQYCPNGYTLACFAAAKDHVKVLQFLHDEVDANLLNNGSFKHSNGSANITPMFIAAQYGYVDVIKYLLEKHCTQQAVQASKGKCSEFVLEFWKKLDIKSEKRHVKDLFVQIQKRLNNKIVERLKCGDTAECIKLLPHEIAEIMGHTYIAGLLKSQSIVPGSVQSQDAPQIQSRATSVSGAASLSRSAAALPAGSMFSPKTIASSAEVKTSSKPEGPAGLK